MTSVVLFENKHQGGGSTWVVKTLAGQTWGLFSTKAAALAEIQDYGQRIVNRAYPHLV